MKVKVKSRYMLDVKVQDVQVRSKVPKSLGGQHHTMVDKFISKSSKRKLTLMRISMKSLEIVGLP